MSALPIVGRNRELMNEILAKIAQVDETVSATRKRAAELRAADERGREIINAIHDAKPKGGKK